jgi:hypothetical protein
MRGLIWGYRSGRFGIKMPRMRRVMPLVFVAPIVWSVACGARTELLVDEVLDAAPDRLVFDARPDVIRDAPPDVRPERDVAVEAEAGPPCVPGKFNLTKVVPELVFLVDRSGSMRQALDGTPATPINPSKWTVLEEAFAASLPGFDRSLQMGAKFFPEELDPATAQPGDECVASAGVEIPPALGNSARILEPFPRTRPLGGTPTSSAIKTTSDFLKARTRSVSRFMVLATDGAPNCNPDIPNPDTCVCTSPDPMTCLQPDGALGCLDDTNTVAVIADAAKTIPTYVIGLGSSSEPFYLATLEKMALAGGRPRAGATKYYEGRSGTEIRASLAEIEKSVAQCTFVTPSAPEDPNAIDIVVNGQVIMRDPTRMNGWDWIDQTFGEIALFGSACALAQGGGVSGTVRCKDGGK